MNYWLLLGSPDKWFGEMSVNNANVNEELLKLDVEEWRVRKEYFKDAKIGDKCVVKISNDTRSIERRTLVNDEVVDILDAGIYATAEISKELYYDENDKCDRVQIKVLKNLFKENKHIDRDMSEKILGTDYFSMSSKKLEKEKYENILHIIKIEENAQDDDVKPDVEINLDDEDMLYPVEVKIQRDMYSVRELKTEYEEKMLILAPDFQREFVWTLRQQSELIESILMGIPLPMVYFFEGDAGIIQVVDGKQRLTSLFNFLDNLYPLSSLPILSHLRGLKYRDLKPAERTKIARHQFVTQTIIPPTPDKIKFDIFERVNRKGSTLNNQEMRNALYQGKSTELLNALANNKLFLKATDHGISPMRMKDKYMILRFLAFYLWKEKLLKDAQGNFVEYASNIDEFVGKTMYFLNKQDEFYINDLSTMFNETMELAYKLRKKDAFRIPSNERKRPINMALMESLGYLFSKIRKADKPEVFLSKINSLLKDQDFITSLTIRIDNTVSVEKRFKKIDEVLEEYKI
ncbi:DUF262 domain-containing protein [Candidatus Sulfurimonas marisnigri]|uniref:DUF262 domain-containing protein n=1 Tax=Candidatus Sulfurimonas marisnigri TaxID=2740405 RepID=A0A7S7LZ09_9BACT|nr:DUF262 domain-containing protein [Candidatus Sulfurimonas marisnigri]QOY54007.1 DUF262 domain-containing protein [Candidatus Sulfurimonas marisnigri]